MHLNFVFRQVVAMLGAVVVSFFVCLLPYRLLSLFQESEGISPEIFYMLVNFCRVMVYLNSAINPILYNLMSSKFRNGFLRLFGLKGFARQGTVTSSSMTNTNTTSTTASSSNAVAQANASLAHHGTLSLHRPLHYRLSSQQPTWSINPPHFVCRWYAHKWALTNLNSKHTIYFLFHVSFWHDIHTRVTCKVVVKQHIFYLHTAWWLFYVVLFCLTNNQFFGVYRFFLFFFIVYFIRYNICMCACIFVKWPRAGGYNRYFAHHANHASFHWWQESERICSPALFEKGKEGYVFCFVIFYTSKITVLYTFVSSYSIILKKISSFFFYGVQRWETYSLSIARISFNLFPCGDVSMLPSPYSVHSSDALLHLHLSYRHDMKEHLNIHNNISIYVSDLHRQRDVVRVYINYPHDKRSFWGSQKSQLTSHQCIKKKKKRKKQFNKKQN